jgi:hypothetical protein
MYLEIARPRLEFTKVAGGHDRTQGFLLAGQEAGIAEAPAQGLPRLREALDAGRGLGRAHGGAVLPDSDRRADMTLSIGEGVMLLS